MRKQYRHYQMLFLVLLLLTVFAFASCNKDKPDAVSLQSISIATAPTKLDYLVGESVDPAGGEVLVKYTDETTKKVDLVLSMLILDDIDMTKEGSKEITVSYKEGEITKTAVFTINVTNPLSAPKQAAKAQLQEEFDSYNEQDYFEDDWAALALILQQGLEAIDNVTEALQIEVVKNNAINNLSSILSIEEHEDQLEAYKANLIDNLTVNYSQERYTVTDWQALIDISVDYADRINAVEAIDNDYSQAEQTVDLLFEQAIAEMDDIRIAYSLLAPANNTIDYGEWKYAGMGDAKTSQNVPEALGEGKSAVLTKDNNKHKLLYASFFIRTETAPTNADIKAGKATLTFWFYVSDIFALGDRAGFFVNFGTKTESTSQNKDYGASDIQYLSDKNSVYISLDNGYVSGWNKVSISSSAFPITMIGDFRQIHFAIKMLEENGEPIGTLPSNWNPDNLLLITDVMMDYTQSAQTKQIAVLETEANGLDAVKTAAIGAINDYIPNETAYSSINWQTIQDIVARAIADIRSAAVAELENIIEAAKDEIDEVPTKEMESLPATILTYKDNLTSYFNSTFNETDYNTESWAEMQGILDAALEEFDTVTTVEQLELLFDEAVQDLSDVKADTMVLAPANDDTKGSWKYSGMNNAALSDNVPAEIGEGKSVVLTREATQNKNKLLHAAFFIAGDKYPTNTDLSKGDVTLTFWIYIQDVEALGDRVGFYISLVVSDSATSQTTGYGDSNIEKLTDKNSCYINLANGYVSGWNKVSVSLSAFNIDAGKVGAEIKQIHFAIKALNSSGSGRADMPEQWFDNQILVTDIRYDYTLSGQTKWIEVIKTEALIEE